jgi:hypothetical protein
MRCDWNVGNAKFHGAEHRGTIQRNKGEVVNPKFRKKQQKKRLMVPEEVKVNIPYSPSTFQTDDVTALAQTC